MAGAARKIDISSSTIFRTILIIIGFWFLYIIRDVLLMLFAAIVLASGIEPVANWAGKYKVPRALTVVLVYILVLAVLSLVVTLMIPPLATQITQMAQVVPSAFNQIEGWLGGVLPINEQTAVTQVQDFLNRFGSSLANASFNVFQQTRNVLSGFVSVLFVFVITFYLVMEKDALKKFFRVVLPKEHVAYVDGLVDRAQKKIGRWILGQLVLGIIMGLIVGVGLWLMGVKFALVLGILAGVMEIIPVIGPIIAAIPAVVIGLSQGLLLGGGTLVFYILVQQVENHVLVPNIMKRAVGLSPLVTLIAVLLGARLIGVVGVILAVPAATILNVFLSDIFKEDEELAG